MQYIDYIWSTRISTYSCLSTLLWNNGPICETSFTTDTFVAIDIYKCMSMYDDCYIFFYSNCIKFCSQGSKNPKASIGLDNDKHATTQYRESLMAWFINVYIPHTSLGHFYFWTLSLVQYLGIEYKKRKIRYVLCSGSSKFSWVMN